MGSKPQTESTSLFMAAIDGGYCTLKKDDKLTIDFASSKALQLAGDKADSIHLTDFMTAEDRQEFFKAYKQHGIFSVKCNLIIEDKLVPTTLKCNSAEDFIYCDITIQADWFRYAARALQDKLDYERLVNYSNTYLFAMDLKWNFINYTANFRELLDLHSMDRNLQTVLSDNHRIPPECEGALKNIFSLNAMYRNDVVEYLKVRNKSAGTWDTYRLELRVIFNPKGNYAEFIVGSFVDVKAELASDSAGSSFRDKETGVFHKNFLRTTKFRDLVSGDTVAAYIRLETSKNLYNLKRYSEADQFYFEMRKSIAQICDKDSAIVVGMGDAEMFIVQPSSNKERIRQCLGRINSTLKRFAAENGIRGCITCGVVERGNNMAPIEQLLDNAYSTYRKARAEGIGKGIFNVR